MINNKISIKSFREIEKRITTLQPKGQTLVELLLALGLFAFIMTAVFALVFGGLTTGLRTEEQDYATMYAQEGLDAARSIRDTNWDSFAFTSTPLAIGKTHGVELDTTNGGWKWKTPLDQNTSDETPFGARKFTREIAVEDVWRTDSNSDGIPDDIFTGSNSANFDFSASGDYQCEGGSCPSVNALVASGAAKLIGSVRLDNSVTPKELTPYITANTKALYHFNANEGVELAATTTGAVGIWHMNGTLNASADAATVTDSQTNVAANNGTGNDGATNGTLTYRAGKFSNALSFDGVDDYVSMGDPANGSLDFGTNGFSVEAWVKPSLTGVSKHIINKDGTGTNSGYNLQQTSANKFLFRIGDGIIPAVTVTSATSFISTDWYHIVGVVDRSLIPNRLKIYINGVEESAPGSDISSVGSVNTGNSFTMGNTYILNSAYGGLIDEAAVYNTALLGATIREHYERGIAKDAEKNGGGQNWQYRKPISISNGSGATQYNYQVSIALTIATMGNPYANIKTDCLDLRFTNSSGDELSYWVETCNTSGNSTVWVKVDSVPTIGATIYMYYGNSAATSISSGNNTFIFFDDFEGASAWTYSENGASWSGAFSSAQYVSPSRSYSITYPASTASAIGYYGRISKTISVPGTQIRTEAKVYDTFTGATAGYHFKQTYLAGTLLWEEDVSGDEGGWLTATGTSTPAAGSQTLYLQIYDKVAVSNFGISAYWDNVKIYNYIASGPSAGTPGTEESGIYNLTLKGDYGAIIGPTPTTGQALLNQALQFDGMDDYITVNDSDDLEAGANFSVEVWFINSDSDTTAERYIAGKYNPTNNYWKIGKKILANGDFGFQVKTSATNIASAVINSQQYNDGNWHHAVGVKSGINVYLYIDGNLVANGSNASLGSTSGAGYLWIGYSPPVATAFWNGSIDEAAIWNKALTQQEIWDHISANLGYAVNSNATVKYNISPSKDTSYIDKFKEFIETATIPAGTSIDYQLSTDNCVTMKYWDGDSWEATGGWNDARTINRYINFLPPTATDPKTICLAARLNTTDTNKTPVLDNVEIKYTTNKDNGITWPADAHTKKVTSRVKWPSGLSFQDVQLTEYLTDWMYGSLTRTTYNDFYCPLCSAENPQYLGSANPDDAATGGITIGPSFAYVRYDSLDYDIGDSQKLLKLVWNEYTPDTTAIHFYLCTSQNSGSCADYMGPGGTNFGTDYFSNSSLGCSKSGTTVTCLIPSNIGIGDGVNDRYVIFVFDLIPDVPPTQAPTLYDMTVQYKGIY